eukprot:scaffold268_cov236-Pinguiococcus_pyrenoidosus.AAC.18
MGLNPRIWLSTMTSTPALEVMLRVPSRISSRYVCVNSVNTFSRLSPELTADPLKYWAATSLKDSGEDGKALTAMMTSMYRRSTARPRFSGVTRMSPERNRGARVFIARSAPSRPTIAKLIVVRCASGSSRRSACLDKARAVASQTSNSSSVSLSSSPERLRCLIMVSTTRSQPSFAASVRAFARSSFSRTFRKTPIASISSPG